jgi:hypothetical protein
LLRWLVGIPMVWMMGITITALGLQIANATDHVLRLVAALLLLLALWITGEALLSLWRGHRPTAPEPAR